MNIPDVHRLNPAPRFRTFNTQARVPVPTCHHATPDRNSIARRLFLLIVLLIGGGLVPPSVRAAVFDYSPPLQTIEVTFTGGSTISYRIFDPAKGSFVGTNETFAGGIFNVQNNQGVLAWNSPSAVHCRVYDPSLGAWTGTNVASGAATSLQSVAGIVAWTSGTSVQLAVYDAAIRRWKTAQATANPANPTQPASTLLTAAGVACWVAGSAVSYYAYDPVLQNWVGQSQPAPGGSPSVNDLRTADGVVAWSAGTTIFLRTYDPLRTGWIAANPVLGNTFDLVTGNGVAAWSHLAVVYFYAYDPQRGLWMGSSLNTGQTFNLSISNGTVFWNALSVNYTVGYNTATGAWINGLTPLYPAFGASITQTNAPMRVWFFDLSLGATTWTWNFGDGGFSTRRAPYHTYTQFQSNRVTLTISGPAGGSATTNRVLRSDVNPPSGSVVINNGDALTTNHLVSLTLAATDNSGLVAHMRFSNDSFSWSNWESFATAKSWTLASGDGAKTVYTQFRDLAGNISAAASDSISVDTTPRPVATFDPASLAVSENAGAAVIDVVLSHPVAREARLEFATAPGTATPGEDYVTHSGFVVFTPGQTRAPISVTLLNDTVVETDESFTLSLTAITNVVAGPSATITILDDDLPSVGFTAPSFPVSEAAGNALVTVQLSAASSRTVTVAYAATNGTATAGDDYTPVSGILSIPPGQVSASFSVPLVDDTLDELSETVLLSLSHATNAVLGASASATLTILDDDFPAVNFTQSSYYTLEGGTGGVIRVTLSKPFTADVRVDYSTANGTAQVGSDYIGASGTLFFSPGQTQKTFQVTVLVDSLPEPRETVLLQLDGFVNATPGLRSQAQLVIRDDDVPRFESSRLNPDGEFQATITGPPGQRFIVQFTTGNDVWNNLLPLTNTTGSVVFTDKGSKSAPSRIYRTELSP